VLATEHLLGFGRVNLRLERIERRFEIRGDVFPALRPFDQNADVVDLLGQAVAQLEIFGEPPLTLQGLLRFRLVFPEGRRRDLLFELG
jgi:hypothetical protein